MSKKTISVAVSGYFDPIHVGHLDYLEHAKKLGDKLIVIVNNNHQCVLKKGKPFMDELDRMRIVKSLHMVDEVFLSVDSDRSVCKSLEEIKPDIFANGGDRANSEIPESTICSKYNIQIIDGLGDKIRSSSSLTGLKEITEEYKIVTIINSHDMNSVMEIGEKIIFLKKGNKEWEGTKNNVFKTNNNAVTNFVYSSNLYKKVREMYLKNS